MFFFNQSLQSRRDFFYGSRISERVLEYRSIFFFFAYTYSMKRLYIFFILLVPLFSQQRPFFDRSTALNVPKQTGNYGVSVVDFNNDGWEDIFIANVPYTANGDTSYCVLLKNNLGENFTNVATSSGIRLYGSYKCGVWGDVNNDGYADLFMAEAFQNGRSHLFINNKDGTFKDMGNSTGIDYSAMASTAVFGDFDNDGKLDLFITTEYPEFDLLYHNTSSKDSISFQDVSSTAGIGGFSSLVPMQVTCSDIDHDGDLDLYAVHDGYFPSTLFRNNGDGTFTDVSFQTGLNDYGAGNCMGLYWKDFDFDGWDEVYVSRIGKAGLYKRQLNGKYKNIADSVGAELNGMSWGIVWEDYDNDGDDDIFTVNSFGFNSVRSLYYENVSGMFIEKGTDYGLNFPNDFYGLAYGDFNNDGYLDLVASATDGNNKLLINTKNLSGNWLKVSLAGTTINRMAVGASVRIVAGGKIQRRTITAGNSYASQMSPTLHFGLGTIQSIDTLEIIWKKDIRQTFTNVTVNEHYHVLQGNTLVTSLHPIEREVVPTQVTLLQNFPNPFNPSTTIEYVLPQVSFVSLNIYDMLGRILGTPVHSVQQQGKHSIQFDASTFPSGTYVYRLQTHKQTEIRKMIVVK